MLLLTSMLLEKKHTKDLKLLTKPFYIHSHTVEHIFSHKSNVCACWLWEVGLSSVAHSFGLAPIGCCG